MEIDWEDRSESFQVLKIEGPDTLSQERLDALPLDWADDLGVTQSLGDQWLSEERSVLLAVPSVLVPETWNVLMNPRHMEANRLKIALTASVVFLIIGVLAHIW
jgi:RES domain-containing protein